MKFIRRSQSDATVLRRHLQSGFKFLAVAGLCIIASHGLATAAEEVEITGEPAVAMPAGGRRPEIAVEQPSGSRIADGAAKKSFGTVEVGGTSHSKTFRIRNTGTSKLSGLRLGLVGVNVSDFSLGFLKVASLPPGRSTTFKVTFTPKSSGTRTATLRISSNDANENPFDVVLTGQAVK